jgi:hypothetical protein
VQLALVPRGVSISFDMPRPPQIVKRLNADYVFRIMRRQQGSAQPISVGQVRPGNEAMVLVDHGIEWEKQYDYWVTPITLWQSGSQKGEVEGEDSPIATIIAHDIFPPATPSGLQAVFSGLLERPFIDLTWTPNSDEDLAGYNVYRHVGNDPPVKINPELVKTPAFHDARVQPGMKYFYSVSAVDLRGNESPKSGEASETVPTQ